MKKSMLVAGLMSLLLAATTVSFANAASDDDTKPVSYNVDLAHSKVGFKVRHLGIASVRGDFDVYSAELTLDPTNVSTLKTSAVIETGSIDTGVEKRDGHLRSADFFDAETYPQIRFVSKEVREIEGNAFQLVGDLTIRDVTREVVLEAELIGPVKGMMGEERIGVEATTKISRAEYGLQWNKVTEAGGIIVGDEVTIVLEIEAVRA